jgi:hypothetical protein
MVYDGDVMDLETQQNNENMYLQLDNKEIMNICSMLGIYYFIVETIKSFNKN